MAPLASRLANTLLNAKRHDRGAPTYSLKRLTVEALTFQQQKRYQKVSYSNHHSDDGEFSDFFDLSSLTMPA